MKSCSKFIFVVMVMVGIFAQAQGQPQTPENTQAYSVGYRMGLLTKFSFKGLSWKSWEGELMLGSNSSMIDGTNPWSFSVLSGEQSIVAKLQSLIGQYVVIKYRTDLSNLTISSAYRVEDVQKVDNGAMPASCLNTAPVEGNYSSGDRIGRIVKISYRGFNVKSWEVIMQLGNSGNQFQEMSVLDNSLAKCLVQFMLTGRRAKITYSQAALYSPITRSTSYQILKAEAISTNLNN